MNTIKHIHYVDIADDLLTHLDKAAGVYAANANITFKILKYNDSDLIVEVRQGKNQREKYQDTKGLIKLGKELFIKFFPDHSIHIHPKTYSLPKVDVVDSKWIQGKMNAHRVSLKSIEQLTGISKSNLSAYVHGLRPMSQPVKAMFFFMFSNSKF
jgi:hypothetical protein